MSVRGRRGRRAIVIETRRPRTTIGGFLLGVMAACGPVPPTTARRVDGVERCAYDVRVERDRPLALDVRVACQGRGVRGLAASTPELLPGLGPVTSEHGRLERERLRFQLPRRRPSASFRYRIDLDAVARRSDDPDLALRRGGSVIAAASTFLLHPLPLDVGTEVEVRVSTPPGVKFVTGLERRADHYRLGAHEIPVGTYAVFGDFAEHSVAVDRGRSELHLVVLAPDVGPSPERLADWVRVRGDAVAAFYGGFPAERALLAVIPVEDDDRVRHGNLLPESAPGIVLFVGARATEEDLASDWILVHELLHIGVPSFYREGKWFDEGMATYFEPIVRARAGLLEEATVWRELRLGMPRGLPALTREGLERTKSHQGMYWGGAIFCLLADIEIRRASGGRVGLEDGLRRVRAAGGHASEVWSLDETLKTADAAFGAPVLERLAARYAERPAPLDLDAVFQSLGVVLDGREVRLADDAPLAWVRRAIVRGR